LVFTIKRNIMRICDHCLEPTVGIEIDGTILDNCDNCGIVEGETHEDNSGNFSAQPNEQIADLFKSFAQIHSV